jgi:type I restriction-modification system DNA methylase subunit
MQKSVNGAASYNGKDKSLEAWIWDAACSIRGAKDAGKFKDFILPLIFVKRLCDVFDDELNRIADEVGSRAKALKLVKHDKKLVRFYLRWNRRIRSCRCGRLFGGCRTKLGNSSPLS